MSMGECYVLGVSFINLKSTNMDYTLKNSLVSSLVLGNCEICGKAVVEVWHFCKFKEFFNPVLKVNSTIQIFDIYGHFKCIAEKHNITEIY